MIYSTSLICCDQANVRADVELLVKEGFTDFHADFMDGHFVPRLGLCPEVIRDLRKIHGFNITINSHLMLSKPLEFVDVIAPYSDLIWVHREIQSPLRVVDYIHKNYPKVKVGLAYNPETDFDSIITRSDLSIDSILVMGINPGDLSSSKYWDLTIDKIKSLKTLLPETTTIYVDGAVDSSTIPMYKKYCTGVICGSSTIFNNSISLGIPRVEVIKDNCERLRRL